MPCLTLKDSLALREAIANQKDDGLIVEVHTDDPLVTTIKDESLANVDNEALVEAVKAGLSKETPDEVPVEEALEVVAAPVEEKPAKKGGKKKGKAK